MMCVRIIFSLLRPFSVLPRLLFLLSFSFLLLQLYPSLVWAVPLRCNVVVPVSEQSPAESQQVSEKKSQSVKSQTSNPHLAPQSAQQLSAKPRPSQISTLSELLEAFTRGLEPDLSDSEQRNAFRIYRKVSFGDPHTNLKSKSSQDIADVLKKYPELEKEPFRNYVVGVEERIYPVTEELSQFLNSQLKSSGQVRSNLFQVDANQGFWKKALGYQVPEKLRVKPTDKVAQKVWQEEAKKHSKAFLDKRFPSN